MKKIITTTTHIAPQTITLRFFYPVLCCAKRKNGTHTGSYHHEEKGTLKAAGGSVSTSGAPSLEVLLRSVTLIKKNKKKKKKRGGGAGEIHHHPHSETKTRHPLPSCHFSSSSRASTQEEEEENGAGIRRSETERGTAPSRANPMGRCLSPPPRRSPDASHPRSSTSHRRSSTSFPFSPSSSSSSSSAAFSDADGDGVSDRYVRHMAQLRYQQLKKRVEEGRVQWYQFRRFQRLIRRLPVVKPLLCDNRRTLLPGACDGPPAILGDPVAGGLPPIHASKAVVFFNELPFDVKARLVSLVTLEKELGMVQQYLHWAEQNAVEEAIKQEDALSDGKNDRNKNGIMICESKSPSFSSPPSSMSSTRTSSPLELLPMRFSMATLALEHMRKAGMGLQQQQQPHTPPTPSSQGTIHWDPHRVEETEGNVCLPDLSEEKRVVRLTTTHFPSSDAYFGMPKVSSTSCSVGNRTTLHKLPMTEGTTVHESDGGNHPYEHFLSVDLTHTATGREVWQLPCFYVLGIGARARERCCRATQSTPDSLSLRSLLHYFLRFDAASQQIVLVVHRASLCLPPRSRCEGDSSHKKRTSSSSNQEARPSPCVSGARIQGGKHSPFVVLDGDSGGGRADAEDEDEDEDDVFLIQGYEMNPYDSYRAAVECATSLSPSTSSSLRNGRDNSATGRPKDDTPPPPLTPTCADGNMGSNPMGFQLFFLFAHTGKGGKSLPESRSALSTRTGPTPGVTGVEKKSSRAPPVHSPHAKMMRTTAPHHIHSPLHGTASCSSSTPLSSASGSFTAPVPPAVLHNFTDFFSPFAFQTHVVDMAVTAPPIGMRKGMNDESRGEDQGPRPTVEWTPIRMKRARLLEHPLSDPSRAKETMVGATAAAGEMARCDGFGEGKRGKLVVGTATTTTMTTTGQLHPHLKRPPASIEHHGRMSTPTQSATPRLTSSTSASSFLPARALLPRELPEAVDADEVLSRVGDALRGYVRDQRSHHRRQRIEDDTDVGHAVMPMAPPQDSSSPTKRSDSWRMAAGQALELPTSGSPDGVDLPHKKATAGDNAVNGKIWRSVGAEPVVSDGMTMDHHATPAMRELSVPILVSTMVPLEELRRALFRPSVGTRVEEEGGREFATAEVSPTVSVLDGKKRRRQGSCTSLITTGEEATTLPRGQGRGENSLGVESLPLSYMEVGVEVLERVLLPLLRQPLRDGASIAWKSKEDGDRQKGDQARCGLGCGQYKVSGRLWTVHELREWFLFLYASLPPSPHSPKHSEEDEQGLSERVSSSSSFAFIQVSPPRSLWTARRFQELLMCPTLFTFVTKPFLIASRCMSPPCREGERTSHNTSSAASNPNDSHVLLLVHDTVFIQEVLLPLMREYAILHGCLWHQRMKPCKNDSHELDEFNKREAYEERNKKLHATEAKCTTTTAAEEEEKEAPCVLWMSCRDHFAVNRHLARARKQQHQQALPERAPTDSSHSLPSHADGLSHRVQDTYQRSTWWSGQKVPPTPFRDSTGAWHTSVCLSSRSTAARNVVFTQGVIPLNSFFTWTSYSAEELKNASRGNRQKREAEERECGVHSASQPQEGITRGAAGRPTEHHHHGPPHLASLGPSTRRNGVTTEQEGPNFTCSSFSKHFMDSLSVSPRGSSTTTSALASLSSRDRLRCLRYFALFPQYFSLSGGSGETVLFHFYEEE